MLGQKRLLFVDDERGVRETLAAILRKYGFAVTAVADTPQALEQIQTHEFDLLLCDLNINGNGDGFDVIRAMKTANPNCAVFVLTGYSELESAIEGIRTGIDDYIIKPANIDGPCGFVGKQVGSTCREDEFSNCPLKCLP